MAHLWLFDQAEGWAFHPMTESLCVVSFSADGPAFNPLTGAPQPTDVLLMNPGAAGGPDAWALLAGRESGVRVNGAELVLGLRALRDKDDIAVAGHRLFFSTEQLASVAPFAGSVQPSFCPRCKQGLEREEPAVMCPRCRAWHHESEKFPCWTYDATCALCQQQPTALDAGYSWTPEEL